MSSPTARARKLGAELRKLRERESLSARQVADRTGLSQSKVSRIENATTKTSAADVGRLLDLYGVDSKTRAALIQLAQEAQQLGWWVAYGDVFTGSFISAEDVCRSIRTFEPLVIPGLLQTGRYARALIEAGTGEPGDVERRVRARLARQGLLTRQDPPELLAVVDEAALRRPVGGRQATREQLRALLPTEDQPHVTVRVLPFAVGAHAGMDGAFTILSFEADPDMAYVESRAGNLYLESTEQLRSVRLSFERLWNDALPVDESTAFITTLIEEDLSQ